MRLYGLLRVGTSMYLCAKHVANKGGLGLGTFDFGPFFRHNLVESGTIFTQT